MQRRMRIVVGGAAIAALAALGTGVASAGSSLAGDDEERSISGDALGRASAAALASTGGGRVTDTEEGDEESLYEVEVTLDDGSEVDVQLDQDFAVVGSEAEKDDAGDDD